MKKWSLRVDTIHRPSAYEAAALPLSYGAENGACGGLRSHYLVITNDVLCRLSYTGEIGANDRVRSCNIHVGSVALCQLSYVRIKSGVHRAGDELCPCTPSRLGRASRNLFYQAQPRSPGAALNQAEN
jgi:hypothetical protein